MTREAISLVSGRREALILFEMLAEFRSQHSLQINDAAERLSLMRLHGALEKTLIEVFSPDYNEIIREARAELIAQSGDSPG